jgi:hypothetical protein
MIVLPSGARVWLACGYTDMRKGMDGLAMLAQQVLREDPFSGALLAFRGKRGQQATFCIRFAISEDCLPVASAFWANLAGVTASPWQGSDMHLHRRAA